jgi:RNA polymerase sigma factor (sigma-70 family)
VSHPTLSTLMSRLRRVGRPAPRTDRELLAAFADRRDEDAFAILLERHGPLVWGLCRRMLTQVADAEDAFQATFLALARSASSIRRREHLAGWLTGVARRVALKARARAARSLPPPAAAQDDGDPAELAVRAELRSLVIEELAELPAKYRDPLVLCHLRGLTHIEAAGELGWPSGSLSERLRRGLELLRRRLEGRGVTLPAAGVAVVLSPGATAGPPAALLGATTRLVLLTAAGTAAPAALPPVLALAEGVVPSRPAWSSLLALGLVLAGAGASVLVAGGRPPAAPPPRAGSMPATPRTYLEQAREAALAADVPHDRAFLLAQIGGSQARAGDRDGARRTLAEAVEAAGTIDKPFDQQVTCWVIARSYLLVPDADGARKAAQAANAGADAVLVDLAGLQADNGDLAGARQTATLTFRPHSNALFQIATAQARAGDIDGGWRTFAESQLNNDLSQSQFLLAVAQGHARAGRFDEARRAIKEARQHHDKNYAPQGELMRVSALVNFALAQAAAGDPAVALALSRSIPPKAPVGVSVQYHYRTLAKYQARYSAAPGAIKFALELHGADIQAAALREVADELAARGDFAGERKALTQALAVARAATPGQVESFTLVAAHAGLGDFAAARKALQSDAQMHPSARCAYLRLIAQRQVAAGDKTGARATLRDALTILDEQVAKVDDIAAPVVGYRFTLDALVRAGGLGEALARARRLSHPLTRGYALLGTAEGLLPPYKRYPYGE